MPHLPPSLILSLLIAMLASGCASQNAMSLLPDSAKRDVAQDKAAKQGPLSVDEMMANVITLHSEIGKQTQVRAKLDETKTAALPASAQNSDAPIQTAYAEEDNTDLLRQTNKRVKNDSPAELFQQALLLNQGAQAPDQTSSSDVIAATANQWRTLIDQQEVEKPAQASTEPIVAKVEPPLVMPLTHVEIIPVNFNETHDGLVKDDDLKLKLLRFGKRVPQQITIGKVNDARGFQVMQLALALGKIIAEASGGAPTITYDPTLSAGAAEVRYPAIGRQS